ncbi:unnamed protein product [Periconia digitata]|uniref:Uncharacterized protein n=1 Tax=Periconia digitata TaxID=1303443 RepID=A0A9W4UMZ5_9PLEO|nr:unnamed protein product [Periconia digitata]
MSERGQAFVGRGWACLAHASQPRRRDRPTRLQSQCAESTPQLDAHPVSESDPRKFVHATAQTVLTKPRVCCLARVNGGEWRSCPSSALHIPLQARSCFDFSSDRTRILSQRDMTFAIR